MREVSYPRYRSLSTRVSPPLMNMFLAYSVCVYLFDQSTPLAMDSTEFRKRGKEMIDYVADYLENIRDRQTVSGVEPGYLRELVPEEAPRDAEQWDDVFHDIERVIMPGVSTLQQLNFLNTQTVFMYTEYKNLIALVTLQATHVNTHYSYFLL